MHSTIYTGKPCVLLLGLTTCLTCSWEGRTLRQTPRSGMFGLESWAWVYQHRSSGPRRAGQCVEGVLAASHRTAFGVKPGEAPLCD